MTDNKLRKAKVLRNTCLNEIHILYDTGKQAVLDKSKHTMFKVRYREIEQVRSEFEKQHQIIVSIILNDPDGDAGVEDTIYEAFKSEYFATKTTYAELFENNVDNGNQNNAIHLVQKKHRVRLPDIELKKYNGDYTAFSTYIELFNSLVHNNDDLDDYDKFHYLISSLEGTALSCIKNIPLNEDNYKKAYDKFIDRFSKKRFRAEAHWHALQIVPKMTTRNLVSLRSMLDVFSENLIALENLDFPTDEWDFVLVMMILDRLDDDTKQRFDLKHGSNDVPTYTVLTEFLERMCIAIDSSPSSFSKNYTRVQKRCTDVHDKKSINKPTFSSLRSQNTNSFFAKSSTPICPLCSDNHTLYKCKEFLEKTPLERYNFCKTLHLCFNCLSNMHSISSCKSIISCRHCNKRHHSLLHFNGITSNYKNSDYENSRSSTSAGELKTDQSTSLLTAKVLPNVSSVLLSTVLVEILDVRGNFQTFRCLLDSGSMTSFITLNCVNKLGLSRTNSYVEVKGLGASNSASVLGGVSFNLRPVGQPSPIISVDAFILHKICDQLPVTSIAIDNWSHIRNIPLADTSFSKPGNIDILLGADVFTQVLLNGRISGSPGIPDAFNTVFGYVLMGKLDTLITPKLSTFFCEIDEPIEKTLKNFWELENVPNDSHISKDDTLCEKLFVDTISREDTGRFVVSLPFRDFDSISFPWSRSLALNRFLNLERRLLKDTPLYLEYNFFMKEYLDLNHMEPVVFNEIDSRSTYYIPHHCVLKPDSSTTKLRVVFNASAKPANGSSLNDHLLSGPKLQLDISTILLNFRKHQYVLCADLKQMYRMILVTREHRDFQRILWRFSVDEPIQDFRLNTVTYGVKSSPYLALRTLRQLVKEDGKEFPLAAEAICHDTYIDDIVTGHFSLDGATALQSQLISLFKRGGFELRKWCSNEPALLEHLPSAHLSQKILAFDDNSENISLKILGLQWNPVSDCFSFSVQSLEKPCTKRNILSDIARIFDPLGFLSPTTFLAKHILQRLWISGLDWDDSPSEDIIRIWSKYKSELSLLSSIRIPRLILPKLYSYCELHGFGDASEKGYCAVIYFRVCDASNKFSTFLIYAKSKVSPLKRISIPRLELCAAVLLSKMIKYVLNVFRNKIIFKHICAWSDSQIVLAWIKSDSYRWKTFVSNRISYIQENISPCNWFYINTNNNPADCASRGLFPSELVTHSLWLKGPSFLQIPGSPWIDNTSLPIEALPDISNEERKQIFLSLTPSTNFIDYLLEKYSQFSTLQRILAYVSRWLFNLRHPKEKRLGPLKTFELHESLIILVKHTQLSAFESEFSNKKLSKSFRKLNAFIDKNDIFRVGGRLKYGSLSYDTKHPILLPRRSRLTDLLIDFYHKKYLHAGLRTVHFLLSQQFWILSPKRAIRSILSKCIICWKTRPRNFQPPMGNLPTSRISQVKAFTHTGVDYAGPFLITMNRYRGAKTSKAYICIFICFATKAVHIELASDLSSEVFLGALQRFIARRGKIEHMYSDCGTNFVGANKQLRQYMQYAASRENINWHFNPPSAPHFGGLWEAGVKSIKTHLSRVVGNQILTFEEFYTVLVLIESVLNSRPLVSLSSDPNDPVSVLTPGHFLTLAPLSALPTPDFTNSPINRLSRWQLLQKMHYDFWQRYHKEYLHTLQQRSKWIDPSTPAEIGTVVLIKNDLTPPLQWSLGKIKSLFPGKDGVTRVATVETANGTFSRPLVKLCPLPLS